MSALAKRISELVGSLGTIEGLERVTDEIGILNQRPADHRTELSRAEVLDLQAALGVLRTALSEMSRVARGMLENAGVRGIDHVG